MTADYSCAEDGSVFVLNADAPRKMELTLHSLLSPSDDVRFDAPSIPGYAPMRWPQSYFVNDSEVAELQVTTVAENPLEKQKEPTVDAWVVLLFDRKGKFEKAVPIPANIDNPTSIGIYGSGNLLLVAANKTTKAAEMFVLSRDGDVINNLLLLDEDYNTGKQAKSKQPLASATDEGALTFLKMVSNGQNLLLFPRATNEPVIEVNEHGIVHTVPLQLPKGTSLDSFLSRSGYVWKVRTYSSTKVRTDSKTGEQSGEMTQGSILEFNSFDGSLLRKINLPAKMNGFIACEHNGDYTALTTDPKDGRLELVKGAEVKQ